ncbi:hypothetical protein [Planococcus versutus]|uniref:Uncharacterized protein n=1 Tax=Planococcus versutus TaxID=1302659 RepID=A0A1B1S544_9BACL|nr:hypothetical protein [Planococcus versutus]ANU28308.1 hypothetical protein I858_015055 [Planococcus versutus]
MWRLKKILHKWIFEKYHQFAEELGYPNWDITFENTFGIYEMEGDTWYSATQLPNKKWAVWNDDEAEPPYAFEVFSSWNEAIKKLRKLFEESGLPEDHWRPEGFDEGEDVFLKEPDREKML